MDFISALTGKSPSTTGAGSEGALTKGPFNALLPITDLNAAFVGYLLTGLHGFSTPAGHIGTTVRIDHDISLLIPEIWCRLSPEEREPQYLIDEELLEKIEDFEHEGKEVPASRLGYRITSRFIRRFAGRVFDNPSMVFDEAILQPETHLLHRGPLVWGPTAWGLQFRTIDFGAAGALTRLGAYSLGAYC